MLDHLLATINYDPHQERYYFALRTRDSGALYETGEGGFLTADEAEARYDHYGWTPVLTPVPIGERAVAAWAPHPPTLAGA